MTPSIGRLVHYTLTADDAKQINKRRQDAGLNRAKLQEDALGYVAHSGNGVNEGEIYPLLITRVWANDLAGVNGQVFLDGNDSLWVTSVTQGDGPRQWHEAPRV